MRVGELFVNLGVKGGDKAVNALTSVRETMKGITSTSLETKAAIAGVFYGLQQLVSSSNAYGLGLKLFADRTDISTIFLQRLEAVMRKSGVTAADTMKSIEGMQEIMTKLQTENVSPKGITAIANVLGEKNFDPVRAANDMEYLFQKLQEYGRKAKAMGATTPVIMDILTGGFGLSKNFAAQMIDTKLKLSDIKPSEIYNNKERNSLAAMATGFSDLGNQIEKGIGRLNIKFGPSLLKDLRELVPEVLKLVAAFADMAVKLHLIAGIGKIFEGWTMIFKSLTDNVKIFNKQGLAGLLPSADSAKFFAKDMLGGLLGGGPPGAGLAQKTNNVTVNTTVHTMGGEGVAQDIAAEIGKIVNDTMRGLQPQGNGI